MRLALTLLVFFGESATVSNCSICREKVEEEKKENSSLSVSRNGKFEPVSLRVRSSCSLLEESWLNTGLLRTVIPTRTSSFMRFKTCPENVCVHVMLLNER